MTENTTPRQASPMVDSTPLLGDRTALLERAESEGYLFFRNFLPRDEVLALREHMLRVVDRFSWREAGQDALGGRLNLDALNRVPDEAMREDIGVSHEAYAAAQKLEALHALPHHPRLIALYREIFDEDVLVHPRHIARMVTGHRCMVPTPPHQDYPLIQGTARTWTCWFPLGDCPRSMGGLTVLRGSHHEGYLPISPAMGAGGIATQLCAHEVDWVEVDYEAGDILTFPSYTVHRALPSQDKAMIRLSLDVRYQPLSEPVEAKSLLPHCDLSWEEIYADWKDDTFQYYWQKDQPSLSGWDDALLQPGRRIC
jgi:ectoine hydroxylase-related dioxygenase (phytanoyl-CoA dioxygenase family)